MDNKQRIKEIDAIIAAVEVGYKYAHNNDLKLHLLNTAVAEIREVLETK